VSTSSPAPSPSRKSAGTIVAYVFATWFGCGFVPKAPGTAGTLGAIPLYLVLRSHGPWVVVLASAVLGLLGVAAASRIVLDRGQEDPQIVVVDEVAGVLLTLAFAPLTWKAVVAGFVLFRIFDQWKPWPANAAERLPRGWGVMADDIVAGLYGAVGVFALARLGVLS
jgi:phosphatidylglycerophosphatase A